MAHSSRPFAFADTLLCLAVGWLAFAAAAAAHTPAVPALAGSLAIPQGDGRCPKPNYPLPRDGATLRALAHELEVRAAGPACLQDPFFHAWRGAVLLALGDLAAAVEPLERALLLHPDLPAAQLDLALALSQLGEQSVAQGLLDQLQQRPDLPPAVRRALFEQQRLAAGPLNQPVARRDLWVFTALVGVDSNLNNAPAVSELTFTLPQGNVTLPLAPRSLPQSGGLRELRGQWQGVRALADGAYWLLQAEVRARDTAEQATELQQADLAATWLQAPDAPRQWIGRVGAAGVRLGGNTLVRTQTVSLQHQWGASPLGRFNCRLAGGAELDVRRFPVSRELNGTYSGAIAALSCYAPSQVTATRSQSQLSLQWRVGQDKPDEGARPGGAQQRRELRVGWDAPHSGLGRGALGHGRLSGQLSIAHYRDQAGYSPLLAENAPRRGTRVNAQLDATFAIGPDLYFLVSAIVARQASNLPAFSGRQRSLAFGFRWESM